MRCIKLSGVHSTIIKKINVYEVYKRGVLSNFYCAVPCVIVTLFYEVVGLTWLLHLIFKILRIFQNQVNAKIT